MRNKVLNLRKAAILAVLKNDAKYGAEIINDYNALMHPQISRQALYVTLGRMEKSGLVAFLEEIPAEGRGNDLKYYAITSQGKKALSLFNKITDAIKLIPASR